MTRNQGKRVGNVRCYFFKCSTCGEEGALALRVDEEGTFECLAGCGTVYLEYRANKVWLLRAVVVPHHE